MKSGFLQAYKFALVADTVSTMVYTKKMYSNDYLREDKNDNLITKLFNNILLYFSWRAQFNKKKKLDFRSRLDGHFSIYLFSRNDIDG